MIKAIIFDMDDTLFPELEYVRSGYRVAASHLADGEYSAEQLYEKLWGIFQADRKAKVFNVLAEQLGRDFEPGKIDDLIKLYREHRPDIKPFAGTEGVLKGICAKYRTGLISDGFMPGQQYKLDALGLEKYFDKVIFTETLGRENWKPSPLSYEIMTESLGVDHKECVYVADNLGKDFVSPNALGWLTVHIKIAGQVYWERQTAEGGVPQKTISHLGELVSLL